MTFSYHGITFTVASEQQAYRDLRLPFIELAKQAEENFEKLYKEYNSKIEDVVEKSPDHFLECMDDVIQHCIEVLFSHQIYSIDASTFWDNYYSIFDLWSEKYYKIADRVAQLRYDEKRMDEYRTMRRQLRGRIIGGGFGLSGALKGMATAGAMNAVIGAGHMLFNGIGKIVSTISVSYELSKIFDDPNTLATLKQATFDSAFACHRALVDCLQKLTKNAIQIPLEDDVKLAQNYLNNAKCVQDSQVKCKLLVEAWQKNPYDEGIYEMLLAQYGDEVGELNQMADYFGVPIGKIKARYLDHYINDSLWKESSKSYTEKARILQSLLNHIRIAGEAAQPYQQLLDFYNEQMRTVSGIVFSTVEEAEQSRSEENALNAIMQNIDWSNLDVLQEVLKKLETYFSPLANVYRCRVREQYCKLEEAACKVDIGWGQDPIIFPSKEKAREAIAGVEQINQRLKSSNLQDMDTLLTLYEWVEHGSWAELVKQRFCKLIDSWIIATENLKHAASHTKPSYRAAYDSSDKGKAGCLTRIVVTVFVVLAAIWIFNWFAVKLS